MPSHLGMMEVLVDLRQPFYVRLVHSSGVVFVIFPTHITKLYTVEHTQRQHHATNSRKEIPPPRPSLYHTMYANFGGFKRANRAIFFCVPKFIHGHLNLDKRWI